MSVVSLADAKSFLDVIHSYDDMKLQNLLEAAEDEAAKFLNVDSLAEWSELPYSLMVGVLFLVQANYQADLDDVMKLRAAAETKMIPYRNDMGV